MGLLLLILGVLCLVMYVSPEFRDKVLGALGMSYDPAMDMVITLLGSFALTATLGLIPGLLICGLAYYFRSRQAY